MSKIFTYYLEKLKQNNIELLSESSILPIDELPCLSNNLSSYDNFAILKLNGGLGTSMGLSLPKCLLTIKDNLTFLDLTVIQIMELRKKTGKNIPFILMNSGNSSELTNKYLRENYPMFEYIEMMQNEIPKIDAKTLDPVIHTNSSLTVCPPGHGDVYNSLLTSNILNQLINSGINYIFISNIDNLGATFDSTILSHIYKNNIDFLMEVCERNENDKKGGHLCKSENGTFLLREFASCPSSDILEFQNIKKHKFFNTNNLWINTITFRNALEKYDGILPLPLIINRKTVDPTDKFSTPVIQMETAMGTAISLFPNSSAVVVDRSRFLPVKLTSDLFLLRSDLYNLDKNIGKLYLTINFKDLPNILFEHNFCKFVHEFEKTFPSQIKLKKLIKPGSKLTISYT